MPSRTATALAGLLVSLALSALLWKVFGTPLVFLFVPVLPFVFGRERNRDHPPVRTCPDCGFESHDPNVEFCPYDGARLDRRD